MDSSGPLRSRLDDSYGGVHFLHGVPWALFCATNGLDASFSRRDWLDLGSRINLGNNRLVAGSLDRSRFCPNSCHAFADHMAICDLGVFAAIHVAVIFLSKAGDPAGKQACSVGDYGPICDCSSAESHPDGRQFLRGPVFLRNVPPLSEYLSIGLGSRHSRPHNGRQRFRRAAASHASRNWLFAVSLKQPVKPLCELDGFSLRSLRMRVLAKALES